MKEIKNRNPNDETGAAPRFWTGYYKPDQSTDLPFDLFGANEIKGIFSVKLMIKF